MAPPLSPCLALNASQECSVASSFGAPCVQATRDTFVDGMMQTGDVFEQRGPNSIAWIDRKSNIVKLSQARRHHLSPFPGACRCVLPLLTS